MTQEYTPTTDEVCECWTTRGDIGNPYETDADVEERHHEESVKFNHWLAAHDAQIRAEALTLTDKEAGIAAEALDDADDESWYYDDKQQVIRDVLKSVASFRKGPKQ